MLDAKLIRIGEAAGLLGISIDTLRRWGRKGKFNPIRVDGGHRYYRFSEIEAALTEAQNQIRLAKDWAGSATGFQLSSEVHCQTRDVFQIRLEKLQSKLIQADLPDGLAYLVTAIVGEIGNNSFDHNLGNWPDIIGIYFYYDVKKRTVILADRGQGVLATLKRVRPELTGASEALKVAFTEQITGRHPEVRGNGLKFVRSVVTANPLVLQFQTGDAHLTLKQNDENILIIQAKKTIRGCFCTIKIESSL